VLAYAIPLSDQPMGFYPGVIEGVRWEADREEGWFYGVKLDIGGGVGNLEKHIKPADVVTKLGDVVRGA
jgi:hypothetical protein